MIGISSIFAVRGIMDRKVDLLGRQLFITRLVDLVNVLSQNKRGCTFAIDGIWGSGKSFVIDAFEKEISIVQDETTTDNKYLVFHYNCWMYDYYEEPSIAIVSSMLDKTEEELAFFNPTIDGIIKDTWTKTQDILKGLASKFIENKIGFNIVEIVDDIKNNGEERVASSKEFDSLFTFKKTLDYTRESLAKIAEDKSIIVVVDELDRCLPEYSIKVLERLHHIFSDIPNIIIIIAIDSSQLKKSINHLYGDQTDVEKYLKKFISFSLALDNGKIKEGFFDKFDSYVSLFNNLNDDNSIIINDLFKLLYQNIDIRTQEKLIERAESIHRLICDDLVDISILCFEIMWLALLYKVPGTNCEWINEINRSTHVGLDDKIGNEAHTYLKKMESLTDSGEIITTGNGNKKVIKDCFEDHIMWYFSSINNNVNNCYCGHYYYANAFSISKEVEIVKDFVDLANIIK
jgi:hypothetical protein